MNVCFRVDAGGSIGEGHAMRCLTLADALAARGATCSFIYGNVLKSSLDDKIARDHRIFSLVSSDCAIASWNESEDAGRTLEVVSKNRLAPDWLIVDHYHLSRTWEKTLRGVASRVLVIDDLANRQHDCDVLVDPTFAQTGLRYMGMVPSECRCLCGAEYALLRPQFREMRQGATREIPRPESMVVHVFFGSVDTQNYTLRFSRLLLEQFASIKVQAAVGSGYPNQEMLQQLSSETGNRFSWVAGVTDMASHMANCDVALGAPGGTTWERACIGLPAAYVAVAANQPAILERLQESGLCAYFGPADEIADCAFVGAMQRFLKDAPKLEAMRRTGLTAIDGLGATRVADILEQLR